MLSREEPTFSEVADHVEPEMPRSLEMANVKFAKRKANE
jgi:hypothetical protein